MNNVRTAWKRFPNAQGEMSEDATTVTPLTDGMIAVGCQRNGKQAATMYMSNLAVWYSKLSDDQILTDQYLEGGIDYLPADGHPNDESNPYTGPTPSRFKNCTSGGYPIDQPPPYEEDTSQAVDGGMQIYSMLL